VLALLFPLKASTRGLCNGVVKSDLPPPPSPADTLFFCERDKEERRGKACTFSLFSPYCRPGDLDSTETDLSYIWVSPFSYAGGGR